MQCNFPIIPSGRKSIFFTASFLLLFLQICNVKILTTEPNWIEIRSPGKVVMFKFALGCPLVGYDFIQTKPNQPNGIQT